MRKREGRFVRCVQSGTYEASREPRKVYRVLDDAEAEARSLLRVGDESGEHYLFPAGLFVPTEVPEQAEPVFTAEASGGAR